MRPFVSLASMLLSARSRGVFPEVRTLFCGRRRDYWLSYGFDLAVGAALLADGAVSDLAVAVLAAEANDERFAAAVSAGGEGRGSASTPPRPPWKDMGVPVAGLPPGSG